MYLVIYRRRVSAHSFFESERGTRGDKKMLQPIHFLAHVFCSFTFSSESCLQISFQKKLSPMLLFILIFIFSFLIQLLLPWWSFAIVAALLSYFLSKKSFQTFLIGFIACGLVWLTMAFYTTALSGSIMTDRIAQLFQLPNSTLLYVICFLVAALVGGLAALTGNYLKKAMGK